MRRRGSFALKNEVTMYASEAYMKRKAAEEKSEAGVAHGRNTSSTNYSCGSVSFQIEGTMPRIESDLVDWDLATF